MKILQDGNKINAGYSIVVHAFILLCGVFFFYYCVLTQDQNWDMLGYAGSVLSLESKDPVSIHNNIYSELKNYASEEDFKKLTQSSNYRETMYKDPEAFMQQVPYYKIRIVFVGAMYLLVKLGVNIFSAGHIVAAATVSLGMIIFFFAYKKFILPRFWVLVPFLYVLTGAHDAGQWVTADSLAYLWFGLICCAFICKHWTVYPLLALSVLMRTDMVVFVALVLSYIFLFWPTDRVKSLVTAIVCAILYISVNKLVGNYGWATVFHFVFVSDMNATHPEEYSKLGVTAQQYISAVLNNLYSVMYENRFWLFSVNVALQLMLFFNIKNMKLSFKEIIIQIANDPIISITILSCAYIAIHYILYPALWSRFFIGQYMIASMSLLYMLSKQLQKN